MGKENNSVNIPTYEQFIDQFKMIRETTAQEVLDKSVNRKPSLTMEVEYSEEGFVKDSICKVPVIGIHHRILFSPEEVPEQLCISRKIHTCNTFIV